MDKRYIAASAIVGSLILAGVELPPVQAQEAIGTPGALADGLMKQEQKAQRKADRARKNAELSELERNGYNPANDATGYPQDLRSAQRRINEQKQGANPKPAI